jgi:hypothetical protein
MIYLPDKQMWLNLDLVRYVYPAPVPAKPTLYVVFGYGSVNGGNDQIAIYGGDITILEEALNARCADEAGEAFLP